MVLTNEREVIIMTMKNYESLESAAVNSKVGDIFKCNGRRYMNVTGMVFMDMETKELLFRTMDF
jgi:hypothetical protein